MMSRAPDFPGQLLRFNRGSLLDERRTCCSLLVAYWMAGTFFHGDETTC